MNQKLVEDLNKSIKSILSNKIKTDYGDWESRALGELFKIVDNKQNIIESKIRNFIGSNLYVSDSPSASIRGFSSNNKWFLLLMRLLQIVTGAKRGEVKEAKITFNTLKDDALGLLKKYPMPETGNPFKIYYKSTSFTNRYLRHIYFLSTFKKELNSLLNNDILTMNIGSSYGVFQCLLKKEIPKSQHILVDIPGQLILAQYYLQTEFPDAKIASITDIDVEDEINEQFIKKYDFVLLPTNQYNKLNINNIDLVTNFVSFVEMPKEWFNIYKNSKAFIYAKYFYTVNRYDSYPTYTSNTTILDFPIDKYQKILFRTLPILQYYYMGIAIFFSKKQHYPSYLFEFIGQNKTLNTTNT